MLDLLMFGGLVAAILSGFPAAFAIAGVAILFALFGAVVGAFDLSLLGALGQRVFGVITNPVLIAIPLFVFMGIVLEKSRIAEELLTTMGRLFGRLPGGLGGSVVLVGALLAASTGIVGATVVAMGLIALPAMLKAGYGAPMGAGIVATSGTLGQIIPPSTLLIILSDVMSNAYQQAQFAAGKFTIDTISVGETFAAALLPGLVRVTIYIAYIGVRAAIRPSDLPPLTDAGRVSPREVLLVIAPPIALILAVLGSILGGVATPSEAAAVGAVGAVLMAGARLGSVAPVLVGAAAFIAVAVLSALRPIRLQRDDTTALDYAVASGAGILILTAMPGGATGALIFAMALIFVLGFFLDFVEISVILLPLVLPVLITMGHDPTWLAVLVAINLQTSFLTPPFGFALFYFRSVAPPEITTAQIYRAIVPFVLIQLAALALVLALPPLATWLPSVLFG